MECTQKFIPEGWNETREKFSLQQLQTAYQQGTVMQGFAGKCDENFNLQISLGKNIVGVIPRNEMDAINSDNFGMTNPNICKNKVNQFVQFKIKEIYDENRVLLSRREAQKNALEWVKNELGIGTVVDRNCEEYQKIWCFR